MTQKNVRVIEMAHMYGARGSFHALRPKKHDQICDPKCKKINVYGEMGCTKFSDFFHHVVVVRFVPDLL